MTVYLILIVAAFFASMVQSISGFAFALVLLGIIPHFIDYGQCVAMTSPLAMFIVFSSFWRFRRYVQWKKVIPVAIAYILFSYVGIQMLVHLPNPKLWKTLLGIFLMVWSLYMLFGKGEIPVKESFLSQLIWGGAGGLMGGLFGMAPILAFYYLAVTDSKESYMGNLQAMFFLGVISDIMLRMQAGFLTPQLLQYIGVAFVAVVLGYITGQMILKRMTLPQLKKAIYGIVLVCGMLMMLP